MTFLSPIPSSFETMLGSRPTKTIGPACSAGVSLAPWPTSLSRWFVAQIPGSSESPESVVQPSLLGRIDDIRHWEKLPQGHYTMSVTFEPLGLMG